MPSLSLPSVLNATVLDIAIGQGPAQKIYRTEQPAWNRAPRTQLTLLGIVRGVVFNAPGIRSLNEPHVRGFFEVGLSGSLIP
jgi:hypothetical protein